MRYDISHPPPDSSEARCYAAGELYRDWAALFEDQPRRFVIGTDFHFGRKGVEMRKYKRRVKRVRQILGTLDPRAARLIAFGNARRMFP